MALVMIAAMAALPFLGPLPADAADAFRRNERLGRGVNILGWKKGNMDSRVRWTEFIARQAERRGWSWAYWQFAGHFVLFDMASQQSVEPIRKALLPRQ